MSDTKESMFHKEVNKYIKLPRSVFVIAHTHAHIGPSFDIMMSAAFLRWIER